MRVIHVDNPCASSVFELGLPVVCEHDWLEEYRTTGILRHFAIMNHPEHVRRARRLGIVVLVKRQLELADVTIIVFSRHYRYADVAEWYRQQTTDRKFLFAAEVFLGAPDPFICFGSETCRELYRYDFPPEKDYAFWKEVLIEHVVHEPVPA